MRTKFLMMLCAGSLLVAGCSSTHELTAAGQSVRFTGEQPGSDCRLLGELTGTQSNCLSGQNGQNGENSAMRGAANDLRNRAAAMSCNVIYGATSSVSKKETYLASFVPLDSKIQRQVYTCP
ncbi:MAG: DUF4156 domain-containing protein [Sodalis sp. (in: enterobacteria)]|uniref:DUF4156 domain-containing protein n=1 Tax=Sodalis sp. (in: enterobacteria) TaxID=1898979 RepID=UPI003F2A6393